MEKLNVPFKYTNKKIGMALIGAGLVYLTEYLSERRKPTPIWDYKSEPAYQFDWDRYVRVFTNPLMKLAATGIITHFWDWVEVPDREDYSRIWLQPGKDTWYKHTGGDLTPLHHVPAHSVLGVQEVYLFGLDLNELAKKGAKTEGYHYAFQARGQDHLKKNRIIIPYDEKIKVLVSTPTPRVLALDSSNNELPSKIEGPFNRNDKRLRKIRQF